MEVPIQVLAERVLIERIRNQEKVYSHCISIGDPEDNIPPEIRKAFPVVLRVEFHDIKEVSDMPIAEKPKVAEKRDIRRIIKFFHQTRSQANGYTIHCHAGVHRSAAVALGILYLMKGTERKARNALLSVKPFCLPNKKVIALFDEQLGSSLRQVNEGIWERMRLFLIGKVEIKVDDYLEELPVIE